MPNQFVCHSCGMITDNPEIHTDGITIGYHDFGNTAHATGSDVHNFHIQCPVCLHSTYFTRTVPFPVDVPINK